VQPTTSFITWGGARLPFSAAPNRRSAEPARLRPMRVVQHSDALVRQTVLSLSRLPAGHILEGAAREEIRGLKPHLQEALEALKEIERSRGLTDQELAQRRAFRMLLETGRILLEQTT
jgi:hypothetical protein